MVGNVPLLSRTLLSAREAGIVDAHIVLGYDAEQVSALVMSHRPLGMNLHFYLNPDWHRENGVSALVPRGWIACGPFALLMGDHIFEPQALRRLLVAPRQDGETLLGVDRHMSDPSIVEEATKVRIQSGRVTAIGKNLGQYDGLDTGLFVCDQLVFDALDESCAAGDTTLSGGIARLARRGLVRAVDVGHARWCDIDTVEDLTMAEELLATGT